MVNIPLFTRFYTSQVVVWDFWTINSMIIYTLYIMHLGIWNPDILSVRLFISNWMGLIASSTFLSLSFISSTYLLFPLRSCWIHLSLRTRPVYEVPLLMPQNSQLICFYQPGMWPSQLGAGFPWPSQATKIKSLTWCQVRPGCRFS